MLLTGNEVASLVAPDGAGHPAAVLLPVPLIQLGNYAGTPFINHGAGVSVTSSVTPIDTTLDVASLQAGATYLIDGYLTMQSGASGGLLLNAGASTATMTAMGINTWAWNGATLAAQGNVTTLAGNMVALTGVLTAVTFQGILFVNAAGSFGLQFAQNASNATPTVIQPGSYFTLNRVA